jgi:hypothetical protein
MTSLKTVHHVPEHPFTITPVYTLPPEEGEAFHRVVGVTE